MSEEYEKLCREVFHLLEKLDGCRDLEEFRRLSRVLQEEWNRLDALGKPRWMW